MTNRQTGRWANRQTDRRAGRQTNRMTGRYADRQTDRQSDRMERHFHQLESRADDRMRQPQDMSQRIDGGTGTADRKLITNTHIVC